MVGCEAVESLLERIASPSPSGGGGAAAALTAATAAALVAMVAGVAARHAPDDGALAEALAAMQALRARMLTLVAADVAAFGRVLEARRRTDDTRAGAVREALIGATEVPLEVAAAGVAVLEGCGSVLARARTSTLADLGVAGALAAGAVEGAALTARANLEGLDAPQFVTESRSRLSRLLREAAGLRARLPRAGEEEPSR
jgi:formiminotetrahydrofolate cyclodeaminase